MSRRKARLKSDTFSTATELRSNVNWTAASPGGYGSVVVVRFVVARGVVVVCVEKFDVCTVCVVNVLVVCVVVSVVVAVWDVVTAHAGQMLLKASW